jgi:DNA-binding CsgD family transcriptional regulator
VERLAASGEEDAVRRKHAAYFLALVEAAEPYLASAERRAWLEQLEMAYDNLRAVLVWSQVMQDGGATELRLAGSLWWFWYFGGYASEGRGWLEDALERSKALELISETLDPADHMISDRSIATVRAQMDAVTFAAAWAAGRSMPLEQAIAEALEPLPEVSPPISPPVTPQPSTPTDRYPAGLTRREVEVLRLIAQGLTEAQVAERLVISAHTVHAHLRAIYGKLEVTSRAAATRFAVDHHLV